MNNRNIWVYDIETLKSAFTYTAINIDTEEIVQYVIHKDRDEHLELLNHLELVCKGQIGFNNQNFDYPIIHYLMIEFTNWVKESKVNFVHDKSPQEIVSLLYNRAQYIIEEQDKDTFFKTVAIRQSEILIPQLDLFRVWHYNNRAKSTSLKALEISMNFPNVMEMPIDHTKEDITIDDIPSILEYNLNDVMATYEFYKKSIDKIELRKSLKKKYQIPCTNWNNGKIGEQLILKLYCDKLGLNPFDVKKWRTYREIIHLKDCVPQNISFNTKEFCELLKFFNTKSVLGIKDKADYSVIYKGIKYDYGLGGIHASIKAGVYESNSEYIIKSCDVSSLYPNLAIILKFYPEHLGEAFLDIYENDIVGVRMREKAKGKLADKTIVDGYKQSANIPYGKSGDEDSFLYDPLYTLKTTIAGQLYLSMLIEKLSQIEDGQVLMANTDGLEIRIPRKHEALYMEICKNWESITFLSLEYVDYEKLIISNVNNYLAITTEGKSKQKGLFEVDKMEGSELAYHKDNSFRIVPIALEKYFKDKISVEETILNHEDIYDFCGRQKFTKESYGETHQVDYDETGNPYTKIIKQQKNVRYYISANGVTLVKRYNKGTSELINKGYKVTIFNKYEQKSVKEYFIDYQFYIRECYKIIDVVEPKQLTMF